MSEIDLIPGIYRKQLLFRQWLKRAGFALLSVSVLIGAAFAFLRMENHKLDAALRELQLQKAISTQQRSQLETLNGRKRDLTQQLELLAGLRSGAAADRMFATIDRALNEGSVWFTDWNFRRAGTVTTADPETVNSGYFIVVPNGQPTKKEAWMIETQMKIDGEALDHAALSRFVTSLIDQPEIQSVRVVRTETVTIADRPLVRFSLDVVVAPEDRGVRS